MRAVSTIAVVILIVFVVGIVLAVLAILGYGIKLDAEHRRRLGRRDRARSRRRAKREIS